MKKFAGFTLIELMVTVAIVGILATIALPAYSEYILRSQLTEPMTELASARVILEQYYQDNRQYGTTGAPSTWTTCPGSAPVGKYFNYSCGWRTSPPLATAYGTDGQNQSFMVIATGIASTPTAGFVYAIDQRNGKQTITAPVGWAAATMPTNCWITKKGGVC